MEDVKGTLEKRIVEIENAIRTMVNNHATLTGHLEEAKFLLQTIFKDECEKILEISKSELPEGEETQLGKS